MQIIRLPLLMDHSKSAVSFSYFSPISVHTYGRPFKVMWEILVFAILAVRYRWARYFMHHSVTLV